MQRVVVIGGGVIGLACAYYLSQSGWQVTIVDRGRLGKGCSHGNCGLVCPSHVFPLAAPGAVRDAMRAILGRNSPFYIKPRLDVSLWSWLIQFARHCDRRHMLEAGHARHALLQSSMALYGRLLVDESIDCEWERRGLLYVFLDKKEWEEHEATVCQLTQPFGISATRYDGAGAVALEPALKPGLAGAWHYEGDAHLRPDKLLAAWRSRLDAAGVEIHEHCVVDSFRRAGRVARAIGTSLGEFSAESFVVATGALTPWLNQQLECRIPIQPGKGYSITMPRPAQCPSIPMIFHQHRVAVTPMQSGFRLGSTMEFSGYDPSIHRKRLGLLKQGASRYLKEPYCDPIEEEWYGWRPMTYDGKPFIGPSPRMNNVFLAAGHNMLGLSMAPATGKLIAELVNGDSPHIDPAPFSVDRLKR